MTYHAIAVNKSGSVLIHETTKDRNEANKLAKMFSLCGAKGIVYTRRNGTQSGGGKPPLILLSCPALHARQGTPMIEKRLVKSFGSDEVEGKIIMLVDEDDELAVEDIQEIEAELGMDLDEYDYYCNGVMQKW